MNNLTEPRTLYQRAALHIPAGQLALSSSAIDKVPEQIQSSDSDDIIKNCVENVIANQANNYDSADDETPHQLSFKNASDNAYYSNNNNSNNINSNSNNNIVTTAKSCNSKGCGHNHIHIHVQNHSSTPGDKKAEKKDGDDDDDEDDDEDDDDEAPLLRVRRVPRESEMVRPCPHNQWTKQTKKRGKLVLKCMVCKALWKTYPEFHTKCIAFHNGKCEKGANCEHPHVYARRDAKSKKRDDLNQAANNANNTNTNNNNNNVHYFSVFEHSPSSFVPDPRKTSQVQISRPTSYPPLQPKYSAFEGATEGYFPPMSNHLNSHANAAATQNLHMLNSGVPVLVPRVPHIPQNTSAIPPAGIQQVVASKPQQQQQQQQPVIPAFTTPYAHVAKEHALSPPPMQIQAAPVVAPKPEPPRVWSHDPYAVA